MGGSVWARGLNLIKITELSALGEVRQEGLDGGSVWACGVVGKGFIELGGGVGKASLNFQYFSQAGGFGWRVGWQGIGNNSLKLENCHLGAVRREVLDGVSV